MDDSRLVTRGAFVSVFWEELRERRKTTPTVSQREVYETIDTRREEVYGEPLFPSFDAFRMYRDSFAKKKLNKRKKFQSKVK